ncbi:hypothetical protein BDN70DRAFT_794245 [Pholiota conissans]|uniref:DUF6535 domain-containing protein n=1 Tax=Pholiota conissans TaxID=109636 RepID=A0A9P5ZFY2_9AGAR|nr:hypothetical protein BDN70DRAFT_794245 [Pholiota conissans]
MYITSFPTVDGYRPYSYDDPSANLWSTYLSKSEKYDAAMAQNWKNDMDAILIFAGLFSASVTTFIVESYKTLNPDPSNASVTLLAQISQQLAAGFNSSLTSLDTNSIQWDVSQFNQNNFKPPVSSIICNVLWFLSLGFSLTCALSATLVEQWTRQYLHASTNRPAPQDRARISAYLNQGIRRYKMAAIVDTIPLLLHISLFLFFAGLVAFLNPINPILQYLILVMLICCFFLYLLVTTLPIFDLSCPYWTPLSNRYWSVFRKLNLLHRRDADGNELPIPSQRSTARELEAIEIKPERDQRDLKSMCWTLNALREDNEFEPFVEVIPNVVSGFDYSAKWLMHSLMHHDDISIKLGHRIPGLLATCTTRLIDPATAQKRAVTCLKAMWSLTMLSLPKAEMPGFNYNLAFKEETFDLLAEIQNAIPSVENLVLSTSIIIARSLLDMYVHRATIFEEHLLRHLETGECQPNMTDLFMPLAAKENAFKASKSRIFLTEEDIIAVQRLTDSQPFAMMAKLSSHQTRLVAMASMNNSIFTYGVHLDRGLLLEALDSVKSFQAVLSQAGLNLSLQYIESILQSDNLPHEAFNTLRRTFFRINSNLSFNRTDSQRRLVTYLEEAVEPTTARTIRLPHTIISILLSLTGIVVTHPPLVLKAINIIENYTKTNANNSAPRALQNLEQALPRDAHMSKPLDLFSSHLYADTKLSRQATKSMSNLRSTTMDSVTVTATIS